MGSLKCTYLSTLGILTCHFIQILLKDFILSRQWIWSFSKKNASRPAEFRLDGKVLTKRVKDLAIEDLEGKWDVSQPFFFYSRAP